MSRVRKYNEGQSFTATFKFFDEDFAQATPTTARYRIDCLTTGNMVRDWTVLTPSQSIDIAVTPDDNQIQNSSNPHETKQIVVQSNYGTDTQAVQATEWVLINLQGVV